MQDKPPYPGIYRELIDKIAVTQAAVLAAERWESQWESEEIRTKQYEKVAGLAIRNAELTTSMAQTTLDRVEALEGLLDQAFRSVDETITALKDPGGPGEAYRLRLGRHFATEYLTLFEDRVEERPQEPPLLSLPDLRKGLAARFGAFVEASEVRWASLTEEDREMKRHQIFRAHGGEGRPGLDRRLTELEDEMIGRLERADGVPHVWDRFRRECEKFIREAERIGEVNEKLNELALEREKNLEKQAWRVISQVSYEREKATSVPELRPTKKVWSRLDKKLIAIERDSGGVLRSGPRPREARLLDVGLRGDVRKVTVDLEGHEGRLARERSIAEKMRSILTRGDSEELSRELG